MQELKRRQKHLVSSRQPVLVFVFLVTSVHCMSQLEWFGVIWVFDTVMMILAREHHFFKALPDSHHEHPSLVPKQCACMMEKYACMMYVGECMHKRLQWLPPALMS